MKNVISFLLIIVALPACNIEADKLTKVDFLITPMKY